ncbi:MAG: ribosome maturation factor RimM [Gammaproteobacteria bacterium]|nr:ribosome maturation factor RimM [Gammaproteobacteria bacterium]
MSASVVQHMSSDVVVIGRIGAPYGVRGWVRISSFTEPVHNILDYEPWLLERKGIWRSHHPVEAKLHKQGCVARFSDVLDRKEAARLSGTHVAVARSQLPELTGDEYYWRDLEGLVVWNQDVRIGVVDHLIDTGANPVLVVRDLPDHDSGAELAADTLIPFVDQFVVAVDLEAGRIYVNWVDWD